MVPKFLIATLSASSFTHCICKRNQLQLASLLLQHNAFTSATNPHKGDTFTMSYLVNSCGLSPLLAMELSERLNLTNPDGPNAVLDLLKNYGCSKTQVARLVQKHPLLLVANAEKNLLPKLEFFHSIGVSTRDIPKILVANHVILLRSLRKCIVPRYEILRGLVRDDQEAARALRNGPRSFTYCDMEKVLVPNIEVLRQSGVPQASISLLLANYPFAAYGKHSKFVEAVKTVEEMGFNPLRTTFVMAVYVTLTMSRAVWESRFEVYVRWGWSSEMALRAFKKFPNFMKLSEKTFAKKMSFLVNDMGWPSEAIAEFPTVLGYSLEKRIIPRLSVIKILKSKGLLENDLRISNFVCEIEEKFLEKFVIKFQQDVPLLPDVYKGLIHHQNVI